MQRTVKVGIVGGGITGLAVQHFLDQRGIDSVVFETASEPGGVIESHTVDDRTLDLGPQRTRLTRSVESLLDSLGIGDQLLEAADLPLYVYRDGALRRVPVTIREGISTDLLSWRGKVRMLLEPLTAPPRGEETIETFLTRTLGRQAAKYLVGPIYSGIYASHPDEMYMKHSLLRALDKHDVSRSLLVAALEVKLRRSDPPPVVSFRDGMQTLPRALYERHREQVNLETTVETIRDPGDGFDLETSAGLSRVDQVVLTTPAAVAGRLLEPIVPESAADLRTLTYNPLAVVHLEADVEMEARDSRSSTRRSSEPSV